MSTTGKSLFQKTLMQCAYDWATSEHKQSNQQRRGFRKAEQQIFLQTVKNF